MNAGRKVGMNAEMLSRMNERNYLIRSRAGEPPPRWCGPGPTAGKKIPSAGAESFNRELGLPALVASTTGTGWQWQRIKRKTDSNDALKLARPAAVGARPRESEPDPTGRGAVPGVPSEHSSRDRLDPRRRDAYLGVYFAGARVMNNLSPPWIE
jgi:hypothetical protein